MIKQIPLILLLFFCFKANSQIAKIFTSAGGGSNDEPTAVLRHSTNKIITTGYYNQNSTFGALTLSFAGGEDVFITCQENNGNYSWAKRIYSPQFERSSLVKEDNAGNIYVAGYFRNFAILGNDTIFSVANTQDIFIAKLDIFGNTIWFRSYGGSALEDIKGMGFTTNNDIWISGQFRGQTQFGSFVYQSNAFYSSGQPGFDVYITRLNSSGDVISAFSANSPDNDRTTGLTVDNQNNIYLTIHGGGVLNIGNNPLNLNASSSGALVKLNPNGNFIFGYVFQAPFIDVRCLDLRADLIAIGGNFTGDLSVNVPGLPLLTDDYSNKIFGINLDLSGNLKNYFTESSDNDLSLNAISINNENQVWVGGDFKCTLNSLSDDLGSGLFNNIGYTDCFVGLYSSNGPNERIYQQHFGGRFTASLKAMNTTNSYYPTLVGSFNSFLYFPFTSGCVNCPILEVQNSGSNCNISNYSRVIRQQSIGNMDVFCVTLLDTIRPTFDIYERTGGCNYTIKPPTTQPNFDTLYLCSPQPYQVRTNIQPNLPNIYLSPKWYKNGILVTNLSPGFNETAQYVVEMTTADGCKAYRDTMQVYMMDANSEPSLSVENTQLFNTNFTYMLCGSHIPILNGDTAKITGQIFSESNITQWYRRTPANPSYQLVAENSNEFFATLSGNYLYRVTTADGCVSERCFNVFVYYLVSVGGFLIPCSNPNGFGGPNDVFTINMNGEENDTLKYCHNTLNSQANILNVRLNLSDTTLAYIPAFGRWTVTGPSVFFPLGNPPINHSFYDHSINFMVSSSGWIEVTFTLLSPPSSVNPIFTVTKQFYILRNTPPNVTATITSSPTQLCPGDTSSVSYTMNMDIPHSLSFNNVLQNTESSPYLLSNPTQINIAWNHVIPETGCIVVGNGSFNLVYKQNPSVVMNPTNGRKCPEDSVRLTAPPGISAVWIGPEGNAVSNDFITHVVSPGNYYFNWVDNDHCPLISNTVEVRNITASIVDSILTEHICAGQPALIRLAPDTNLNYQWLPPLFGSDTIKYISNPGTYSVQVSLCSNIDTLTFDVNVGLHDPYLESLTTTSFCEGQSLTFTATDTADTYLWTPGNISTQEFYVANEGWISVTVTDKLGCILTDSLYVVKHPLPPTPEALIAPEACPGTPITITAESDFPLVWHLLPDSTALATSYSYEMMPESNQVIVSAYAVNQTTGCQSGWVHQALALNALTQLTPMPQSIIFCPGDTIQIQPVPSVGIQSGIWSGPNQFEQIGYGLFIPEIEASQEGTYLFLPTVQPGYCTYDEHVLELQLRQLPEPVVSYEDSLCAQQTISLQTITHPHYTYSWLGPNNSSTPQPNWTIPNVGSNHTGFYQLQTQVGKCIRVDSFFVFVSQLPPPIPQLSYNPAVCLGDTLFLFNADSLNTAGVNMIWLGSNQFITNSAHSAFIPNMQNSLSNSIGLQYGINQCLSEVTMANVVVNQLPVFEFEPLYEFCEGDVYQIHSPIPANAYFWSGGQTSSSIFIAESDTIILTIRDANGCRFSDTTFASALNCLIDGTPNAFSPNGDGINDEIIFTVEGGTIYQAYIYDRWGKLINEITGTHSKWDGRTKAGNRVADGTYFYTLKVVMINGKEKELQGTVAVFQ